MKKIYDILFFIIGMFLIFYIESKIFKTEFLMYRPVIAGLTAYFGYFFMKRKG